MSIMGDNSMRRDQTRNNTVPEIYIGNIAIGASREDILKFFEMNIVSLRLLNKKNKVFAFATFNNLEEAEEAVQRFNQVNFMGHILAVRLSNNVAGKQNNNKIAETLSQMPKLEDIDDDDLSEAESDSENKSYNDKMNSVGMPQFNNISPKKNSSQDSLNIQPDSNGMYTLSINRKDPFLRSRSYIEKVFSEFGPLSNVSITDDGIILKMTSRQQAMHSLRAYGQEFQMSVVHNSADANIQKKNQNRPEEITKSTKIYIGNISSKATKELLGDFLSDVNVFRLDYFEKPPNKIFAFAIFNTTEEADQAVKMYANKFFLGSRLVIRLADDRNAKRQLANQDDNSSEAGSERSIFSNKMTSAGKPHFEDGFLDKNYKKPQMPKLEDIEDDNSSDGGSNKSYNSNKRIPPMKNTFDKTRQPNDFNKPNNKLAKDFNGIPDDMMHNDLRTDHQDQHTLFVGNFPIGMSEEQLLNLFQEFHVTNVRIINNHNPKRSTQALVDFPNQRDSVRAANKFDKFTYIGSSLLVTSADFCQSQHNQKSNGKNKASSQNSIDQQNGSYFPDRKQQDLGSNFPDRKQDISTSVQHQLQMQYQHHQPLEQQQQQQQQNQHQQQQQHGRRNSQNPQNSSNRMTPNKRPPMKSSSKRSPPKDESGSENNPRRGRDNVQKNSQVDDTLTTEAAKMMILVRNFQIQPSFGSSTDAIQVMITSVVNNELFWGNVFSTSKDDVTDFMNLHTELQSSALSWPQYNLSKKDPRCVALFQGDWYRAWVTNQVERDLVEVFFLDYGNVSRINFEDVRSPNESVWKLQPKARAFKIDNNSEKLTPKAENQFLDVKICKPGILANGFISVVSL